MECKGEKCDNYYSCVYFKLRFNVEYCNKLRSGVVSLVHKMELQQRREILQNEQHVKTV